MSETMAFRHQCIVRFDDLDSYGHVNNVTFAAYLQEARIAFARAVLDDARLVVVRQSLRYRVPVVFRTQPLVIALWVTSVGTTSFTANYDVRDDETSEPYVTAETVLVVVDPQTQRPTKLTDDQRRAIESYVREAA